MEVVKQVFYIFSTYSMLYIKEKDNELSNINGNIGYSWKEAESIAYSYYQHEPNSVLTVSL